MTVQEFFTQYDGRGVDFDGYYGNQCVDLVQFYNRDVIGAPVLTGNAADIWNTYPQSFYDRIPNTPDNQPTEGDIVIWSSFVGGGAGHIAVAQTADLNNFTSFDQNWPDGSNCHAQAHDYANVLGWLHPKAQVATQQVNIDELRAARDKNWNLYQAEVARSSDLSTQLATANTSIANLTADLQKARDDASHAHSDLAAMNSEESQVAGQLQDVSHERDALKLRLDVIRQAAGLPDTATDQDVAAWAQSRNQEDKQTVQVVQSLGDTLMTTATKKNSVESFSDLLNHAINLIRKKLGR